VRKILVVWGKAREGRFRESSHVGGDKKKLFSRKSRGLKKTNGKFGGKNLSPADGGRQGCMATKVVPKVKKKTGCFMGGESCE